MDNKKISLIIASNRGPVTFKKVKNKTIAVRGAGGLVSGLSSVLKSTGGIWISSAMSKLDKELARENKIIDIPENNPDYTVKFLDIEDDRYDKFYNVISNRILWFCFHYLWRISDEPNISSDVTDAWDNGYKYVNKLFANSIIESINEAKLKSPEAKPVVMLQDYHLLLAAKYIKNKFPDIPISHFTHTVWPQPDYFSILPNEIVSDIFTSMVENNILGFQSKRYADNFIYCCKRLLDCKVDFENNSVIYNGKTSIVRTYPISIDPSLLNEQSSSNDVRKHSDEITDKFKDKKIILKIERVELTKNTIRGLYAYKSLLKKYPRYKGKVILLVHIYPSRDKIAEYNIYLNKVIKEIEDINKQFRKDSWKPIVLEVSDNYDRSLAALNNYDVLLVNPVFDGMNLVAKEGPLVNKKNGVLVLSENTGAYEQLKGSVLSLNPFDIEQTVQRLQEALDMSLDDRKQLYDKLLSRINEDSIEDWANCQVKDLLRLENLF